MTSKKQIELPVATITYLQDQIIELKFKDDIIVTEKDAQMIDEVYVELAGKKPFKSLIDSRDIRGDLTTEARDFFANDPQVRNLRKGQAIVVNSLANKLFADFYLKFHKPFDPVKIFNNDYDSAFNWLLSLPLDIEY